jgi:hypothetical protein
MLAFQKFGQKYYNKTFNYIVGAALFGFFGAIGVAIVVMADGIDGLYSERQYTNLLLQSTAACAFFLFIRKIYAAYMQNQFFNRQTLGLITTLARLIILHSVVIQPAFYFVVAYYSGLPQVVESLGVITYLANVNLVGFAAGFGLHVISVVHKVARNLEEEQNLTV